MTEGQIQGKWFSVQDNGEFETTEFDLARSNCVHKRLNELTDINISKQRWGGK